MSVVRVEGLMHAYEHRGALQALSFAIEEGEVFGLLGPNGAGKTTTVGILTSQIVPTGGRAWILGKDVVTEGAWLRPLIGLAAHDVRVTGYLTVGETLAFYGVLYGLKGEELRGRVSHLLSLLDLADRKDQEVRELSEGLARRLNLALALVHDPAVLFLDEPTVGLDPRSRHGIWQVIRELRDQGKTVLLTTHYMEEAELLCDRVAILDRGEIVALGSPGELKATLGEGKIVEVETACDESVVPLYEEVVGEDRVMCEGGLTIVTTRPQEVIRRLFDELLDDETVNIRVREPTLEDAFMKLTGRTISETGEAENLDEPPLQSHPPARFLRFLWPRRRRRREARPPT